MNPVLKDFILDLQKLRRMFKLANHIVVFRSCALNPDIIGDELLREPITRMHEVAKESHSDMPILNGVLLLYLAGRFENYVKEIFEDLCDSLAGECREFGYLPKQMQDNLVKYTAEVISSPRKYGHAENGVIAFVSTMSDNLNRRPLNGVNSKCLSITTENMWPDTLNDLFARIGANKIWEKLGQQASLQAFFQEGEPQKATSEAKNFLTRFMEIRNKIAHPSGIFDWPSLEIAQKHVDYCETIARAIADVCTVWTATLPVKNAE